MASKSVVGMMEMVLKLLGDSKGFDRVLKTMQTVSASKGQCVCELTVDESHLNRGGTLHGGLTATLVDNVSTLAIMSTDSHPGVSLDMNISYLNAAKVGDVLKITSDCVKRGKKIAFATVDISRKSDGCVIAVGRQTKYIDI